MVSGDDLAVDFHGVGIDKAREAFDHVDFILTQYVVVRGMNTVDIALRLATSFSQSKWLMVVSKP